MGSWNETCAVSKMTINYKEAIRYFLIAQNPYHYRELVAGGPKLFGGSTGCSVSDLWIPVCMPIRGIYDSYGSIDVKADVADPTHHQALDLLVSIVNALSVKVPIGENECHDLAVTEGMTIDRILEVVREGRLYFKLTGTTVPVSLVMIKESVWQSLLDDGYTRSELDVDWSPDRARLFNVAEVTAKYINLADLQRLTAEVDAMEDSTERTKKMAAVFVLQDFSAGRTSPVWNMNPVSHFINHASMSCQQLNELAEMDVAFRVMDVLRIGLHPTIGSGSQTENATIWKHVFSKWKKIAIAQEKSYEE